MSICVRMGSTEGARSQHHLLDESMMLQKFIKPRRFLLGFCVYKLITSVL